MERQREKEKESERVLKCQSYEEDFGATKRQKLSLLKSIDLFKEGQVKETAAADKNKNLFL